MPYDPDQIKKIPKEQRLIKAVARLQSLSKRDFYGKTVEVWEAGKIVHQVVQETFKIDD